MTADHDDHPQEPQNPVLQTRREFLVATAAVAAGVGAAGLLGMGTACTAEPDSLGATGSLGVTGAGTYPANGMAAFSPKAPLRLVSFRRRALGPRDVAIRIHYCGICHSDIHMIRGDWGKVPYPLIVGHEIAGEVVAVGPEVSRFKAGSRVGVGSLVNSCRRCVECAAGYENYCQNGATLTYGGRDRDGSITQGGYSTFIVVDEAFVIDIPAAIDLAEAGPLLCAGITVYSPLRRWGVGPGQRVAVVGMGGLGHMAVKLATALGAEVTVFTTSPDKVGDAKRFGASEVVVNRDGADFSRYRRHFDFALDTVPYRHDLERFIPLLKRDATYCRVGIGRLGDANETGQLSLVLQRNSLAGSNTGGIRETQEMVDFCAARGIRPEITKIAMNGVDAAWDRVVDRKARYRFVMDMRAPRA